MLNKFIYWNLEKGCLVFAVISALYSLFCFIGGMMLLENVHNIEKDYSLHIFMEGAPEHAIRIVYVMISVLDLASSVLMVVGIIKVRVLCELHEFEIAKYRCSLLINLSWICSIKQQFLFCSPRIHSLDRLLLQCDGKCNSIDRSVSSFFHQQHVSEPFI